MMIYDDLINKKVMKYHLLHNNEFMLQAVANHIGLDR